VYDDPRQLRRNVQKFYISDDELELVNAGVRLMGKQKATLLREWVLQQAMECARAQIRLEGSKSSPREYPACLLKKSA
jgi:hypothetical protein